MDRPSGRIGLATLALIGGGLLAVLLVGAAFRQTWEADGRRITLRDDLDTITARRIALGDLKALLVDAETGQRGFLLTRLDRYLDPYRAAEARADDVVAGLLARRDWTPQQAAAMRTVADLARRKLDELARTVALLSAGREREALDVVLGDEGKRLMDAIRTLVDEMVADLDRRAAGTQAAFDEAEDAATRAIGVLAFLVLVTLLGTALSFRRRAARERRDREGAEDLARTRDTLNAALVETNALLARREADAKALSEAKTRFVAAASHDLRQPLHAMALHVSALRRRTRDPDAAEIVDGLQDLVDTMRRMFAAMLDVARIDSGTMVARTEPIRLSEIVEAMRPEFAAVAREKGLSLRVRCRPSVAVADRDMVEAVLRNLVGNAVKFTDAGGVLVTVRPRGGRAVLEVHDTGRGIAEAHLDRIFEEYERLPGAERTPGFGLGLAIVARMCRLMDAPVEVRSRPGRGSCFRVSFPTAADLAPAPETATADEDGPSLAGMRILVVDDDDALRTAMARDLADRGAAVRVADGPAAADAVLATGFAPDAMLLDLNLGNGADGLALADRLEPAGAPSPGVLVVTASTDPDTIRRLAGSGRRWLTKPVDGRTLARGVSDAASRAGAPSTSP